MKLPVRFLGGLFCCALLAGCGGSGSTLQPQPPAPQTWNLAAGTSAQGESVQGLQFYASSLTIDAGDTVRWTFPPGEPHSVTFLGPQSSLPPAFDPAAPKPAGGPSYDASAYTSSGYLLLGKTYALTFPKPGTYKYYCILHGQHGGMQGVVVVQPAGTAYPQSQAQIATAAAASSAADIAQGEATVLQFPYAAGGTHVAMGMSFGLTTPAGPVTSTVLSFLSAPALAATSVSVPVNGSVTWTNLSINEPHTVTLGIAGRPFPSLPNTSPRVAATHMTGRPSSTPESLLPAEHLRCSSRERAPTRTTVSFTTTRPI